MTAAALPTWIAEDLARSGITEDEAIAAGIRSVRRGRLEEELGFDPGSDGYAIPYPNTRPIFTRYRLKDPRGGMKYAQKKGVSRVALYFPETAREAIADPTKPLLLVEGEKKAMALAKHGHAAVGIPGVWSWKSKNAADGRAEGYAHVLTLATGREVVVAFDADARTNPKVAHAAHELAVDVGGASWCFPPAGGPKGWDDVIFEQGTDYVRGLLEARVDPQEPGPFVFRELLDRGDPCLLDPGKAEWLSLVEAIAFCGSARIPALCDEARITLKKSVAWRVTLRTESELRFIELNKEARDDGEKDEGGSLFHSPEPWPHAVKLFEVLDEIVKVLEKYLVLPPQAAETIALWIAHTYCFKVFHYSPRLAITSPVRQCGKSLLFRVMRRLIHRPLPTENATVAAIFRAIEAWGPSILADEYDAWIPDNEELRGIVNSGFERGGSTLRCVGDDHEPTTFSTFCPVALAGIGELPGTVDDRSMKIHMQRKSRDERVEVFYEEDVEGWSRETRRKLQRWAEDHREDLDVRPTVPESMNDRARDRWRTLIAVAESAGGEWPARARKAAVVLEAEEGIGEPGKSEVLLAAVHGILDEQYQSDLRAGVENPRPGMATAAIITKLQALPESPYGNWNFRNAEGEREIKPMQVARRLRPYKVRPAYLKLEGKSVRGYRWADVANAAKRYAPDATHTGGEPAGGDSRCDPVTEARNGDLERMPGVTEAEVVTPGDPRKPARNGPSHRVTPETPPERGSRSPSGPVHASKIPLCDLLEEEERREGGDDNGQAELS